MDLETEIDVFMALMFLCFGFFSGVAYARSRAMPVIKSLQDVSMTWHRHLLNACEDSASWKQLAMYRNITIGQLGQDMEILRRRENAARDILTPIHECDPAIREWLKS